MKFLAVRNFDTFQHYRDRNPPWIKLYYALLDDYAFLQLTEQQQIHLVMLWLVASRHDNRIPYDEAYVRAAIRAKRKVDLAALIASGFLVVIDEPNARPGASAHASTDASGESSNGASAHASTPRAHPRARATEAEGETERETDPSSPPAETAVASRFTNDVDRDALAAVLRVAPSRTTWLAEIKASLDGMAGHTQLSPALCGEAMRDFLGNGAGANPNLSHFRGYLRNAAKPKTPRRSRGQQAAMTPGEATYQAALRAVEDL